MSVRQIESWWLTLGFIDELILIYPVYAIMMQNAGVSGFELSVLFIIWSVSALVLEIPTGIVGDRVNRKNYLAIGALIKAGGFAVWYFFPSFPGFAAGFVVWSVGGAISSGTMQSLLYDLLAQAGRTQDFARIFGRGRAAEGLGVFVAMALGGYAAESGFSLPLLLSVAAPVVYALLISVVLTEPPRSNRSSEGDAAPLAAAITEIVRSPVLAVIVGMLVLLMSAPGVLDEFVGPLLEESASFTMTEIGLLYGLMVGSRTVGAAVAHRFRHLSLRQIAWLASAASGLLIVSQVPTGYLMGFLCTGYFATAAIVEVALETQMQARIESHARATISSLAGAGMEACGVLLYLGIGLSADKGGWSMAFVGVGGLTLLMAMGFSFAAPMAGRVRSPE